MPKNLQFFHIDTLLLRLQTFHAVECIYQWDFKTRVSLPIGGGATFDSAYRIDKEASMQRFFLFSSIPLAQNLCRGNLTNAMIWFKLKNPNSYQQ